MTMAENQMEVLRKYLPIITEYVFEGNREALRYLADK